MNITIIKIAGEGRRRRKHRDPKKLQKETENIHNISFDHETEGKVYIHSSTNFVLLL